MRYTFTSEFLKVVAPATSFGDAWEMLCLHLLRAETGDTTIQRLVPPDRGVDILQVSTRTAYQCKSSERGALGTIAAGPCIDSIDSAKGARNSLGWESLKFAINAPLTGSALAKINEHADAAGMARPTFLPPEHWSELCERHPSVAEKFLDYRMLVSEADVIEALRKARYYDDVVQSAAKAMQAMPMQIDLRNNRTPLVLSIPFSSELTIEKLLDAAQQLMGIKLDRINFPELGTSCRPTLSINVDTKLQTFSRRLSDLSEDERAKLQLWIQLRWRDELKSDDPGTGLTHRFRRLDDDFLHAPPPATVQDRGKETLRRTEALIQDAMWQTVLPAAASSDG